MFFGVLLAFDLGRVVVFEFHPFESREKTLKKGHRKGVWDGASAGSEGR